MSTLSNLLVVLEVVLCLLKVGIELEFYTPPTDSVIKLLERTAKGMRFPFKNHWGSRRSDPKALVLKEDGTAGMEINLPYTSDLQRLNRGLRIFEAEFPHLYPYPTSEEEGLHVHVEWKPTSLLGCLDFFKRYCKIEDWLFAFQPECRFDNEYCQESKDYLQDVIGYLEQLGKVTDRISAKALYKVTGGDHEHYMALSLSPLEDYGTVEFRMSSPTWLAEDILNWARICRNVVQPPKLHSKSPDLVNHYCPGFEEWARRRLVAMKEFSRFEG